MTEEVARRMQRYSRDRIMEEGAPGQHPYSTRRGWYSITRIPGHESKFRARSNEGQTRNNMVFLPDGYAEYRAIIRGEGINTTPVTFNLTGEFLESMRIESNVQEMESQTRIAFTHEARSYGNLSNTQLLEILNRRGAQGVFGIPRSEVMEIVGEVLSEVQGRIMGG